MQLKFNRKTEEKKGFFGGSKTVYIMEAMLDLTPEEQAAMKKLTDNPLYLQWLALGRDPTYKLAKLLDWAVSSERKEQDYYHALRDGTILDLVNGMACRCDSMPEVVEMEEGITKAVKTLKTYIVVGQEFANGSERVVDI